MFLKNFFFVFWFLLLAFNLPLWAYYRNSCDWEIPCFKRAFQTCLARLFLLLHFRLQNLLRVQCLFIYGFSLLSWECLLW